MGLLKETKLTNGWTVLVAGMGVYGTNYRLRALVTAVGLGANRPQDAIYPVGEADADGKPFDGANRYVMHFPAGQLPPVDGFWSLTMYDDQYFFVPNKLNRFTLSARNALKHNADGSVDLYLQASSPGAAKVSKLSCRRRRPASSSPCCGSIRRRRHRPRSSMAPGSRRRSRKRPPRKRLFRYCCRGRGSARRNLCPRRMQTEREMGQHFVSEICIQNAQSF